ncbi:MAG TPA: NYN domain-containing protein [Solirubrobacteraceae bacterium]
MRWLVDGMNVIGSRPDGWWKDRHAAMVSLVESLERWSEHSGEQVTVVFERAPRPAISSEVIEIAYAPRARRDSADDEIVRRVGLDPRPDELRVVSSDHGLAKQVLAAGAAMETAGRYRRLIESHSG